MKPYRNEWWDWLWMAINLAVLAQSAWTRSWFWTIVFGIIVLAKYVALRILVIKLEEE